jgi:hypothetical protein
MIITGYGETLVGMPEGSPFSLADTVTLAYLIDGASSDGEWTRFDYSVAEGDLWDARCGGREALRARLRLLSRHGLIDTKTVGVKGEHGVRTFYRVNMAALASIEVSPAVYRYRVLQY